MSALTEAYVAVKPDTKDFAPLLKRQLGKVDGSRAGRTVGGGFGKGFALSTKKLLVAGAIFKGIQGLGRAMSGIWGEGTEAIKAGAQTAAVIKSTGGAARVTAADVEKLSDAISKKTGIDDEQIAAGQNMLLTFTRVRNEQGKGNDIFAQATRLSVDLAKATGKDLVGANVMLGKALNDPTRGLTALTRVGVTFDDGQRKQIKSMQEHGNIAGAQKIILAELRKEFGGSAAAQATFGEKAKVAWANVKEGIGVGLIKSLDAIAPALEQVGTIALETFKVFSKGVGGSKGAFQSFADFLSVHQGDIVAGFIKGGEVVLAFGEAVIRMASGTLRAFGTLDQAVSRFFSGFLDFTGDMLHGAALAFRWLPGIGPKLRKASEDFAAFSVTAKKGYADQGKGAFAAADKLDGYAAKAAETRHKLHDLSQTEVWKAKQRDAANAARIAIQDIGTKADGSQLKLKTWNKRTELGAVAQRALEGRIKAARQRMIEQRDTGIKAGATQGQLTRRWDQGKQALFREFKQMGLSNKAARDLTERYGKIPRKAETKVTQPGMHGAIESAKELKRRIDGIKNKSVSLSMRFAASATAAAVKFFKTVPGSQASGFVNTFRAEGGRVPGHSPHPRADNIPVMATAGEYVHKVPAVRYYGNKIMSDINEQRIPKMALQGFAAGGPVRRNITVRGSHNAIPGSVNRFIPAGAAAAGDLMGDAARPLSRAAIKEMNTWAQQEGSSGPVIGSGSQARRALAQIGSTAWGVGKCLMFVRQMAGARGGEYSASTAWSHARHKHPGSRNAPSSTSVFWGGGLGHVAVSVGNGNIVGTDFPRRGRIGKSTISAINRAWGKPYRGWSNDINGVITNRAGLADGGVVRGGRGGVLAHIGEGSRDELVTPLPRQGGRPMAVGGVTFAGPIHVHGVTDAAEMVRSLQAYAQRNGGVRLKVLTP